ncbi:MAG: SH3-like domain-containing protein [Actinomycetota bacterium]
MAFSPGDRVRTRVIDPPHHTRLPRYARGRIGSIVELEGAWPLADLNAQGTHSLRTEPVYAVRFRAQELWGSGDHDVVLDLWESYLEEAR